MQKAKRLDLHWLSVYRNELYGFAILWVMIFHGYDWAHIDYSFGKSWLMPLHGAIVLGNSGVDLFLLLSGISLYFAFSKNTALRPFYIKRYRRLFPAVLLINVPYWAILYFVQSFQPDKFFLRVTLQSFWFGNDRQVWYVAAIAVLYFLYPFVYHFLYDNPAKFRRNFAILLLFTFATVFSVAGAYPDMYDRLEIAIARFPAFFIGCALGRAVKEKKQVSLGWVAAAVAGLALVYVTYSRDAWIDFVNDEDLYRYMLSVVGASAMILMTVFLHLVSFKPLHKFLCFFGNMSLELYIAHTTVYKYYLMTPWDEQKNLPKYLVVLVISVAVAWLCVKCEDWILSRPPFAMKKKTVQP